MASNHHVDHIACSRPATRRWVELAWMVKVWGTAALVLLMLEVAGLHPSGVLMRIWTYMTSL